MNFTPAACCSLDTSSLGSRWTWRRFLWTPQADRAFQFLKDHFTSASVLQVPDGCLHPCSFFSRKLSSAEQNYDIGTHELLAVKVALEEWRHWLEGTEEPFLVWTDHKNLQYLQSAKRPNSRHARWALFFNSFRFHFSYRPGLRNTKPEALSRVLSPDPVVEEPSYMLPRTFIVGAVSWEIGERVRNTSRSVAVPAVCPPNHLLLNPELQSSVIHWANSSPFTCGTNTRRFETEILVAIHHPRCSRVCSGLPCLSVIKDPITRLLVFFILYLCPIGLGLTSFLWI